MAKFIVGMIGEEAYHAEANDLCEALANMMDSVVAAGNFEDIKQLCKEVHELEASCILSVVTRDRMD